MIEKIVVPAIERFDLDQPAGINQAEGMRSEKEDEQFDKDFDAQAQVDNNSPITDDWTKDVPTTGSEQEDDDLPF